MRNYGWVKWVLVLGVVLGWWAKPEPGGMGVEEWQDYATMRAHDAYERGYEHGKLEDLYSNMEPAGEWVVIYDSTRVVSRIAGRYVYKLPNVLTQYEDGESTVRPRFPPDMVPEPLAWDGYPVWTDEDGRSWGTPRFWFVTSEMWWPELWHRALDRTRLRKMIETHNLCERRQFCMDNLPWQEDR